MSKMYIMQGLPASGKSTKAEEIIKRDGNTVRINRDLLRKMLHFDHWSGKNEGLTKDAQRAIASEFLSEKKANVIIDDTNLNEGTLQSWKDFAKKFNAKFEVVKMDTPVEECLKRDKAREHQVGEHVIIGMAMKAGLYPKPQKGIVIYDIDGTLADCSHRQHFVRDTHEKDWKAFFNAMSEDSVRLEIVDMLMAHEEQGYEIFIVSGRPETYRGVTENWLNTKVFHGYKAYKTLFMRPAENSKPDTEIKQKIYDDYFKNYNVHMVVDDRPSVIRMWESNGLAVTNVGNGEEF